MGILDAPSVSPSKLGQSTIDSQRSLALESWFAALANRDNSPAKWLAIGDSITEGSSASANTKRWVQRSLDLLRARFPTAGLTGGGFGHIPAYYNGTSMGTAYTSLTGVTPGTDNTFGFGRRSAVMSGNSVYTYTITGTSFDLWYVQGPSTGTIGVSIDGGAVTSIPTTGNLTDGKKWNSGALSAGSHTVAVSVVSGSNYFTGITVHNGDETKGIKLWEAGHYGWKTGDWTSNASYWPMCANTLQPNLVSIALMTNDYQGNVDPATCKSNIQSIISAVRGQVTIPPSFVLVCYPARTDVTSPTYPWSSYVNAAHSIAASDSAVSVLDLSARMSTPANTALATWAGDKVHPVDKGHALIADTFVGFVSPR